MAKRTKICRIQWKTTTKLYLQCACEPNLYYYLHSIFGSEFDIKSAKTAHKPLQNHFTSLLSHRCLRTYISLFFHWNMKICFNAEMNLFFVICCLSFWYLIKICKKLVERVKNVYWKFPSLFSHLESCASIIIFAWMPFISTC